MAKKALTETQPDQAAGRGFWIAVGLLSVLLGVVLSREITRPFYGLHAWADASVAWRARTVLKYPLSYTKGLPVWAVGDPPRDNPNRSLNHPPLSMTTWALQMAILGGTSEWSLRTWRLIWSIVSLVLLMRLLRHLIGEKAAILAGLIFVLLPLVGYFGTGGRILALQLWAIWCYLVLIGALEGGPKPRAIHKWGLAVALFLGIQLNWGGVAAALAIGLHYLGHCIWRRHWPDWGLLAFIAVPPLVSLAVTFTVMLAGFGWDAQKILDLYAWRGGKGEEREFLWGNWLAKFWEFALTNFTRPVLMAAIAYVLFAPLKARLYQTEKGRNRTRWYFPGLGILLLPGVLLLLIFRGGLWRHQYWEALLAPFVAIAAAGAVVLLWEVIGLKNRLAANIVCVAIVAVMAAFCVMGTNHYYYLRWQAPAKIEMFKRINQRIAPNQRLLSFESFTTKQHEVKGAHYRPEVAYYLDREIEQAHQFDDIRRLARTGRFPVYLMPGPAPWHPTELRQYLVALHRELAKHYPFQHVPGVNYEVGSAEELLGGKKRKEVLRYGMSQYFLFDLTRPKSATAPPGGSPRPPAGSR